MPDFQNLGIGHSLIEQMQQRADAEGLVIELFVETYNPAKRLYDRLGFTVINESGVYLRMRREPRVAVRNAS